MPILPPVMDNPFPFGRPLSRDELIDRHAEIESVVRTVRTHGTLFLIGPRRFGKTSVLRAADEVLTKQGAIVLRHDAEAYPGLDALVQAIVATAAARLGGRIEHVGEKISAFFGRLRPEVSFNTATHTWSARLGLERGGATASQTPLLLEALDGVAALAAASRHSVALVLDEFQRVIELGGPTAEAQIRATIQEHDRVAYIFAGSKTHLLNDMTLNPARPFYRLGARLFLGPIPRPDYIDGLTRGFAATGCQVEPDGIAAILELSADVPYNVQALAHTAWELLRAPADRALTRAVVLRARDQLVSQDDPFYASVWNALTVPQQRALIAVIETNGRRLQSQAVTRGAGLAPATMRKSLLALEQRSIIRREEAVGDLHWQLEDPFLGAWVLAAVAAGRPSPR